MATRLKITPEKVLVPFHKKLGAALKRFGAYARRFARSSIKKARLKKKSDLTEGQEATYQSALRDFKAGKRKDKPVRGYLPSEPGKPPRWHPNPQFGGKSPLRELILFHHDPKSQTVTVGPEGWRTRGGSMGIGALEKGGTAKPSNDRTRSIHIRARPFMVPAMNANLHVLRSLK